MTTLLVLVAVSLVGPLAAARLRLPAAAVLIVLGVVIGPMFLKWVGDTRTVAFTAELGFLILMFIAGMEIDFNELRRAGSRALVPPVRTAVVSLALAFAVGYALSLQMAEILVISATSIGMPLAVLTETGTLRAPIGRQVLLTGSIGEFLSILVITIWQVSIRVGPGLVLLRELAVLAFVIVISAYAMRFARALAWWYPRTLERTAADHEAAEIGVRTGLFVMLAFVVFVHTFKIEAILGAFIAGTLVSFVLREKRALEAKVSALGHGLFIPVFFIVVGVRFEPHALDAPSMWSALKLVLLAATLKIVPMVLLGSRELDRSGRLAAGVLLSAPLTLVVAIGAIGQQLSAVTAAGAASFVVVALVLSVVFPAIFRRLQAGTH